MVSIKNVVQLLKDTRIRNSSHMKMRDGHVASCINTHSVVFVLRATEEKRKGSFKKQNGARALFTLSGSLHATAHHWCEIQLGPQLSSHAS